MDDYEKVLNSSLLELSDENAIANEDYESARSQFLMIRSRSDMDDESIDMAEEVRDRFHKIYLGTKKRLAMKKFQSRLDTIDDI